MPDCADLQAQIDHIEELIDEIRNDPEPGPGGHPRPIPQTLLTQLADLQAQRRTCTTPGVYRCDDGGAYYAAQAGSSFYWFGEKADGSFANVFVGQRSSNSVTGQWFDVPKGLAQASGTLTVTVDDAAGTIARVSQTGGFSGTQWQLDHPFGSDHAPRATVAFRRARYQGDPARSLTGTWKTADQGTAYLREIAGALPDPHHTVVWFAESGRKTYVFSGTLSRDRRTLQGSWAMVPKLGQGSESGTATLQVSPEADFNAAQLTLASGTLPDHAFDRVEALDVVVRLDTFKILHTFPNVPFFVASPPYQVKKPGTGTPFGPSAVWGHYEMRAESGDEPYLWTFFATIDGSSVSFQHLQASHAVILSTSGSHNNLTPRENLPPGTELPIPPKVGRFATTLMTIRGLDRMRAKANTTLVTGAVALEEDDIDNSAMERGRAALIRELQEKLDGAIQSAQAPDDATVDTWVDDLQRAAKSAIEDAISLGDKILIGLGFQSRDAVVGTARDIAGYEALEQVALSTKRRAIGFFFPTAHPSYLVNGHIEVTTSAQESVGGPILSPA